MRSILLLIILLAILIRTLGAVQAGILGWTWLTLMTPQKLVWGIAAEWPLNLVLAVVTLVVWLASRQPKRLPMDAVMVLWVTFMAFITFTTFFALAPDLAWAKWSLAIKVMILGFMITVVMTTRVRIHAVVWVIALSLGYFGVKGGVFTLLTAGQFRVLPAAESLGDNNSLALALCLVLPLMNYIRLQSASRFVRWGAIAAMVLTALGILGTYSRGGLIGLGIMGAYLWWHSKNRISLALVVLVIAYPAYRFMPASWTERMGTIESAGEDVSFQNRIDAWRTAFNIAKARPFTGGGFDATLSLPIYRQFNDNPSYEGIGRAAHSIYFEVLGDHGFAGLTLYLALLIVAWRWAGTTRLKACGDPQLGWIADLAAMIQVSLITFMVTGAALSMAYYDIFYLLLGITVVLRRMVVQHETQTSIPVALGIPPLVSPIVPH